MTIIQPNLAGIAACADKLSQGETIAMPTETVYGLAADATCAAAIAKLYALKQRPRFNPLICHVHDMQTARQLGIFNQHAEQLAAQFWPGPLTLIVPRQPDCPVDALASAGLATLAIRIPAHPVAQDLLRTFKHPLVAPSANPSGRLSPSTAAHVAAMLPSIDVLEGGACAIGLESTIIGCLDDNPMALRAGGLARDDIEACLGQSLVDVPPETDANARLAPGRLARHYAPKAPLRLNVTEPTADALLIGFGADAPPACIANLSATGALPEAAANLFAVLHEADAQAIAQNKSLAIMPIPTHGLGEAINDRLIRAAHHAE